MFSILIRDTARSLRNLPILKWNLPNAVLSFDYSTFTTRDFLYENSDETGTLLTRFVKYLAMENSKFDPLIPTTIRYPDFFPVTDPGSFQSELRKIDVAQIPHLIVFAFTYKSNGDPQKFVRVINDVDGFCEKNLDQMDYDTIFRTLYAFMFLLPNKITKTYFYNKALVRLVADFDKDCPKEKFVKACFYLGLGKKNPQSTKLLNNFLWSHLPRYLPELTAMDLSIVANAAYKASVPITNKEFLNQISAEILKLESVEDDALLVNLIKVLRYHRIKSTDICEKLDAICTEKELRGFQVTGIAHLFAYLAECQWNNKKTCSRFVNEGIYRLRAQADYVRAKDIATFLWCCTQLQLGELLQPNDLRYIDDLILQKIERDEYKYYSDQLIDSALSLWMLGHHSRGLVAEVTSLRLNPNAKNPERAKLDTRHKLLISCIAIEKPDWLMRDRKQVFVESLAAPEYLVKNRPSLGILCDKLAAERLQGEIVSPIEGINLAGILLKEQKCYLEILEDDQVLKFNELPSAIVQLKMRLLKTLGYNVVMIRANEIEGIRSVKELINGSEEPEEKQNVAA